MTLLVGRLEGHPVCKKLGVGLLVVTIDWSFARVIAPDVATTCITLSSNNIENGDILVPANPGPPEKIAIVDITSVQNSMFYIMSSAVMYDVYVKKQ